MGRRFLPVAIVVALVLLVAPATLLGLAAPDAVAAPEVQRLLPEAKRYLAGQLDLGWAHLRYRGAELRERDDLVILRFELRPFPFVASEGAYLVSRCTPLIELDPNRMGGGRGVTDFETDLELTHARSEAQRPCD